MGDLRVVTYVVHIPAQPATLLLTLHTLTFLMLRLPKSVQKELSGWACFPQLWACTWGRGGQSVPKEHLD